MGDDRDSRGQGSAIAVLVIGTLLFGAAIAARSEVNPFLSNAALAVFIVIGASAVMGRRLPELFVLRPRRLLAATALALLMVLATHLSFRVACEIWPALHAEIAGLYVDKDAQAPHQAFTLLLIAIIVLAEEVLWRGVAVDLLQRHLGMGKLATGVLATLLYTVPQWIGGEWVLMLAALFAGGVFTAQRLLVDDLSSPLLTHLIWTGSIFSLLPLIS